MHPEGQPDSERPTNKEDMFASGGECVSRLHLMKKLAPRSSVLFIALCLILPAPSYSFSGSRHPASPSLALRVSQEGTGLEERIYLAQQSSPSRRQICASALSVEPLRHAK